MRTAPRSTVRDIDAWRESVHLTYRPIPPYTIPPYTTPSHLLPHLYPLPSPLFPPLHRVDQFLRVRVSAVGYLLNICEQVCIHCRLRPLPHPRVLPPSTHVKAECTAQQVHMVRCVHRHGGAVSSIRFEIGRSGIRSVILRYFHCHSALLNSTLLIITAALICSTVRRQSDSHRHDPVVKPT